MNEKTIFQKIIDRDISAHIVYEDADFIVFLDIHPRNAGHCQVVPKKVFRWVWDLPTDRTASPNIASYFELVHTVANAQREAFHTECIRINVAGEEVPHAHVWVWPEHATEDPLNFVEHAEKLFKILNKK